MIWLACCHLSLSVRHHWVPMGTVHLMVSLDNVLQNETGCLFILHNWPNFFVSFIKEFFLAFTKFHWLCMFIWFNSIQCNVWNYRCYMNLLTMWWWDQSVLQVCYSVALDCMLVKRACIRLRRHCHNFSVKFALNMNESKWMCLTSSCSQLYHYYRKGFFSIVFSMTLDINQDKNVLSRQPLLNQKSITFYYFCNGNSTLTKRIRMRIP